jgi:hypothetical protein
LTFFGRLPTSRRGKGDATAGIREVGGARSQPVATPKLLFRVAQDRHFQPPILGKRQLEVAVYPRISVR